MASITSSVGLATGIDIQGTVDQLMALAAVPRDNLQERTDAILDEQVAITELSAYLYAVQSMVINLGKEELFEGKVASSSNEAAMIASVDNDNATVGSYTFTTLKTAQNEQWLSQGVFDDTASLGGGEFSFRFGDNLERNIPLEILNGGDGFQRGIIRITDRSGAWADIDLRSVQTLEDVTEAISSNLSINVTAVTHGDGIRLIDNTGDIVTNLRVQEVSGSTAASLGLDGINVAADVADGDDLVSLFEELDLTQLNDGNGVHMALDVLEGDIGYTLADGTTGTIDFTPSEGDGGSAEPPETLGELIDLFNAAEPGKLQIEIDEDGKRLVVHDLTEGENPFTLTSENDSHALRNLGLVGEDLDEDGMIQGRRLLGGTGSVLVSTLNGGNTETLGSINVTNRAGTNAVIDLSDAETVEEVLEAIETSGLSLTAELNDAKNGIRITDTTGSDLSNLIIAGVIIEEGDPDTAALLGITADTDQTVVESGDLHQQIISYDTLLDDLNGGAGIARGNFTVTGTNGLETTFRLADPLIRTVGDLINAASQGDANITLDINPNGDGIVIKSNGTGEHELQVTDSAKGTAASLHLTGEAETMEIEGEETLVINGSMTHVIELEEGESLQSLTEKINEIAGGATASIFNDGSIRPYRLMLKSDSTGLPGSMVIDTSALGLNFKQTVEAQNAAISLGTADSGVLLSSTTNSFTGVIDNVTLEVSQVSASPVTITIGRDETDVVASVMAMVNNYNNFRDRYNELTAFNTATGKGEILFSDSTTRRVGDAVNLALTDRYVGVGNFQTLRELGISITDDGTLTFDETVLSEKFAEDPEGVMQFFTADTVEDDSTGETVKVGAKGFAVAFQEKLESLIGQDTSTMATRYNALDTKIRDNEDRIDFLTDRLAAQRERLLWNFYYMEIAISKLQSYQTAIDSIQPLDLSAVSKMRGN